MYFLQKIHYILSRFRVRPGDGPADSPTPSEFIRYKTYLQNLSTRMILELVGIRYVLEDVRLHAVQDQNDHWQPLHRCCPFCLLHFR